MRLLLLVIGLLACELSAQNVGIGTLTPTELLDVAGKTKTRTLQVTTGATTGYVLTSDVAGNATWQPAPMGGGGGLPAGSTDQTLRCVGGTTWAPTSDLVVTSTGHVGIGDPTPSTSYDLTIGTGGFRCDGGSNLITGRLGVGITSAPSISYDLDIGSAGFRSIGSDNVITGQLGVNRSSAPSYDLQVDGDARFNNIGVNTNPSTSYKLYVSGTVRFSSLSTGTGTPLIANSSGDILKQSSTRKHKDEIADLHVDPARVLALRPVSFRWKQAYGGTRDVGLIAEEVALQLPELVWREPKRTYIGDDGEVLRDADGNIIESATEEQIGGVYYDKLPVYLLSVVASQQERIAGLERRLAELEAANAAAATLEERLARIEQQLKGDEHVSDQR